MERVLRGGAGSAVGASAIERALSSARAHRERANVGAAVAVAILTLAACGKPARITGRVVDQYDAGVEGAQVEIPGTQFAATTDATGAFELDYAPGHVEVLVSSDHTSSRTRSVDIAQLAPYPLSVTQVVRFPSGTAPVAIAGAHGERTTPLREAWVESVTRSVGTIRYGIMGSLAPAILRARELHVPGDTPLVRGSLIFVFAAGHGSDVPALMQMTGPTIDGHCELDPSVRVYGDRTTRCPLGALAPAAWPGVGYITGPSGRVAISIAPTDGTYCLVYGRSDGRTPPHVSGVSDRAHCFRFEQDDAEGPPATH